MKKKLIILAGSLMALAICATTYFSANANSDVSLLMQNVEAVAQGEGATTSWNCSGGVVHCSAKCGVCKTEVNGSGRLTGSHECN